MNHHDRQLSFQITDGPGIVSGFRLPMMRSYEVSTGKYSQSREREREN